MSPQPFVPALRFRIFSRIYEPLVRVFLRGDEIHRRIVDIAALNPNEKVIDVGSGTGTMAVRMKRAHPSCDVIGLEVDDEMIQLAKKNATKEGLNIQFRAGSITESTGETDSVDVVVSCLLFHHLNSNEKAVALERVYDLLRPGGRIVIADWGSPASTTLAMAFFVVRIVDGFERTRMNVKGEIPAAIARAGFCSVQDSSSINTILGTVRIWTGIKPAHAHDFSAK